MPVKYPNQKTIRIKYKAPCDNKHIYAKINKDALFWAMKRYSGRKAPTFQLWLYLASNQEGYEFSLSQKAVEEDIGLKADAYHTAVKNLIDDEYLIQRDKEKKTIFDFYEVSEKVNREMN